MSMDEDQWAAGVAAAVHANCERRISILCHQLAEAQAERDQYRDVGWEVVEVDLRSQLKEAGDALDAMAMANISLAEMAGRLRNERDSARADLITANLK